MTIESMSFADSFIEAIGKAVKKMLINNKEAQELDSLFSSFIVSFNESYDGKLFNVFSGAKLGFKNIDKIFLFLKKDSS